MWWKLLILIAIIALVFYLNRNRGWVKSISSWFKALGGSVKDNVEDIIDEMEEHTDRVEAELKVEYDKLYEKTKQEIKEYADKVHNIKISMNQRKADMIDELKDKLDDIK